MAPDTKGELLAKVKTLAQHGDRPAQPAREGRARGRARPRPPRKAGAHAHASQEEGAATFDAVMPGLTVLLDDELQQMQAAASQDARCPPTPRPILTSAIAADQQIETLVNQYWPPAPRKLITTPPTGGPRTERPASAPAARRFVVAADGRAAARPRCACA